MIEWEIRVEPGGPGCQDRAAVLEIGQAHVIVVADGAGGMGGGRAAAEGAIAGFEGLRPSLREAREPETWCAAIQEIDRALLADAEAGETTIVLVACVGDALLGASVGDSEAQLFREASADLTEHQNRRPFVGSGEVFPVPFGPVPFRGTLVAGSDGLFKYATPEQLREAALRPSLAQAADGLCALPRLPSGAYPDDVALVLARPR